MIDYRTSFASTPDAEMYTTVTEREIGVWAGLSGSQASTGTTYHGLVDLSDTVNWPHDETGRLDFTLLRVSIDKANAARGAISLGIITRINATNADIVYIDGVGFLENDASFLQFMNNISPMQLKTNIDGSFNLSRVKTTTKEVNVTAVNTGITLPPFNFTPAVGDCIARVVTTTGGTLNYGIGICYHSHP